MGTGRELGLCRIPDPLNGCPDRLKRFHACREATPECFVIFAETNILSFSSTHPEGPYLVSPEIQGAVLRGVAKRENDLLLIHPLNGEAVLDRPGYVFIEPLICHISS